MLDAQGILYTTQGILYTTRGPWPYTLPRDTRRQLVHSSCAYLYPAKDTRYSSREPGIWNLNLEV